MPYKLSPDKEAVLVKKGGKWVLYKRYKGKGAREKALDLLAALKMNVRHG